MENNLPTDEPTKALMVADSFGAMMRNRYSSIYDACGEDGLGSDSWEALLVLLNLVENERGGVKVPYNDFRILLEKVFLQLHQHKILPDAFVGRDVSLGPSYTYLRGRIPNNKGPRFVSEKPIFSVIVAKNVDYILTATQLGSHSEDITKTTSSDRSICYIEEYVPKHHLLPVLTHMLLDVIDWAQSYIRENSDPEENEKQWVDLSEPFVCEGVIIRCGNFLNIQATTHTDMIRKPMRLPANNRLLVAVDDKVRCKVIFETGQSYPTCLSMEII